jgi:hypothetical protein
MTHAMQVVLTVGLLIVAVVAAVVSDVVRIRALREAEARSKVAAEAASRVASAPSSVPMTPLRSTVPSIPVPPVVSGGRSSRLAASLKEPRRTLSPGAMAAIERGSTAARKSAAKVEAAQTLQQVG